VISHEKEDNCVKFEVGQTWLDPYADFMFVNFTDCDTGRSDCIKAEEVAFYENSGTFRSLCVDGSAIVQVYLLDTGELDFIDMTTIPPDCLAPSDIENRHRCGWTFEISCECRNPNCLEEGEFCLENGECCSETCFKGQCAPYQLK